MLAGTPSSSMFAATSSMPAVTPRSMLAAAAHAKVILRPRHRSRQRRVSVGAPEPVGGPHRVDAPDQLRAQQRPGRPLLVIPSDRARQARRAVVDDAAAAPLLPEVTLHLEQRRQRPWAAVRAGAVAAPRRSGPRIWRVRSGWRRAAPVHARRRQDALGTKFAPCWRIARRMHEGMALRRLRASFENSWRVRRVSPHQT